MAGEVFRLCRDVTGETFRLMFPFFLSLLTEKKCANVTFGRGKVFPQALHVAGFLPALYPYSTTESGHDRVQPGFPHLTVGRQATGACDVHSKQKPDSKRVLRGLPRWQMQRKLKPVAGIPT